MAVKQTIQKLLELRCKCTQEVLYYLLCGAYVGAGAWQLQLAMPSYDA